MRCTYPDIRSTSCSLPVIRGCSAPFLSLRLTNTMAGASRWIIHSFASALLIRSLIDQRVIAHTTPIMNFLFANYSLRFVLVTGGMLETQRSGRDERYHHTPYVFPQFLCVRSTDCSHRRIQGPHPPNKNVGRASRERAAQVWCTWVNVYVCCSADDQVLLGDVCAQNSSHNMSAPGYIRYVW